jgi:Resolvase, N terminal domain
VEDALVVAIQESGLPSSGGIVALINKSAEAFRRAPPDYNACLAEIRAALQTLATEIAVARRRTHPGSSQEDKWGQVMAYWSPTMIAAVYARKSTEQHVADEAKSFTRQLEQAKVFAARQGRTVDEAHVFVDDGISGSEFARRPGLMALLNALKPRAPFDVLLIYDADRLGREQVETAYFMKQLLFVVDGGVTASIPLALDECSWYRRPL